ncbi:DUF4245 domain-containing protein, partial [Micromonospora sp. KC207]
MAVRSAATRGWNNAGVEPGQPADSRPAEPT